LLNLLRVPLTRPPVFSLPFSNKLNGVASFQFWRLQKTHGGQDKQTRAWADLNPRLWSRMARICLPICLYVPSKGAEVSFHRKKIMPTLQCVSRGLKAIGFPWLNECPLYPQKRTSPKAVVMSALCQKQTFCAAAKALLFGHVSIARPAIVRLDQAAQTAVGEENAASPCDGTGSRRGRL